MYEVGQEVEIVNNSGCLCFSPLGTKAIVVEAPRDYYMDGRIAIKVKGKGV